MCAGDYFRVRYADCDGHCFSDFSVHFPNKLWWLGGVLLAGATAVIILLSVGSGIYQEALAKAPAASFTKMFAGELKDVTDDEGNRVSGVEMTRQLAEKVLEDMNNAEKASFEEASGQLTGDKVPEEVLTVLVGNSDFRSAYLQTFLPR